MSNTSNTQFELLIIYYTLRDNIYTANIMIVLCQMEFEGVIM